MRYLDFDLEIGDANQGLYPIRVLRSPAGEASATIKPPFTPRQLETHLRNFQQALLPSAGGSSRTIRSVKENAANFGKRLFDATVIGDIRRRYDVSREQARDRRCCLRLRLRVHAPDLAALPWEFLVDSQDGGDFLALSTRTSIVRYVDMPYPVETLEVIPPLRVLGMIALPTDLKDLGAATEQQRLERATASLKSEGKLHLEWLQGNTLPDLQRAMRSGPWHVFHFVGHGEFNKYEKEGSIAFANEQGLAQWASATKLARVLADHPWLRVVFLNTCEGARESGGASQSSAAARLVRRGIPAALAVQFKVSDAAAILFASTFYEVLAECRPVDFAVAEARKAIAASDQVGPMEWGSPVLHLRSTDDVLIPHSPAPRTTLVKSVTTDVDSGSEPTYLDLCVMNPRWISEASETLTSPKAFTWHVAISRALKLVEENSTQLHLHDEVFFGDRPRSESSAAIAGHKARFLNHRSALDRAVSRVHMGYLGLCKLLQNSLKEVPRDVCAHALQVFGAAACLNVIRILQRFEGNLLTEHGKIVVRLFPGLPSLRNTQGPVIGLPYMHPLNSLAYGWEGDRGFLWCRVSLGPEGKYEYLFLPRTDAEAFQGRRPGPDHVYFGWVLPLWLLLIDNSPPGVDRWWITVISDEHAKERYTENQESPWSGANIKRLEIEDAYNLPTEFWEVVQVTHGCSWWVLKAKGDKRAEGKS